MLDHDFETALKSGALAPQTPVGVTVGVLRGGVRRMFSYGTARPDSIFEIGAGVVRVNTTVGPRGSLADLIGQHSAARFAGQPVVDL
jgi:hypothetical protein